MTEEEIIKAAYEDLLKEYNELKKQHEEGE
jgi:hypothetical protein